MAREQISMRKVIFGVAGLLVLGLAIVAVSHSGTPAATIPDGIILAGLTKKDVAEMLLAEARVDQARADGHFAAFRSNVSRHYFGSVHNLEAISGRAFDAKHLPKSKEKRPDGYDKMIAAVAEQDRACLIYGPATPALAGSSFSFAMHLFQREDGVWKQDFVLHTSTATQPTDGASWHRVAINKPEFRDNAIPDLVPPLAIPAHLVVDTSAPLILKVNGEIVADTHQDIADHEATTWHETLHKSLLPGKNTVEIEYGTGNEKWRPKTTIKIAAPGTFGQPPASDYYTKEIPAKETGMLTEEFTVAASRPAEHCDTCQK